MGNVVKIVVGLDRDRIPALRLLLLFDLQRIGYDVRAEIDRILDDAIDVRAA